MSRPRLQDASPAPRPTPGRSGLPVTEGVGWHRGRVVLRVWLGHDIAPPVRCPLLGQALAGAAIGHGTVHDFEADQRRGACVSLARWRDSGAASVSMRLCRSCSGAGHLHQSVVQRPDGVLVGERPLDDCRVQCRGDVDACECHSIEGTGQCGSARSRGSSASHVRCQRRPARVYSGPGMASKVALVGLAPAVSDIAGLHGRRS